MSVAYLFFAWTTQVSPAVPAAAPTVSRQEVEELARRIGELDATTTMYLTGLGVGVAIVGIMITILGTLASVAGIAGWRSARRLTVQLRDQTDVHARKVADFSTEMEQRFALLQQDLSRERSDRQAEFEQAVRFTREVVGGEICYRTSDFNGAVDHYRSAAKLRPDDSEINYYLARALTYVGSPAEAIAILRNEVNQDPTNARAIRGLALALRFDAADEALEKLDEAARLVGANNQLAGKIENERGLVFRDRGEHERALKCHQSARRLHPYDPITDYFIGIAHLLLGNQGDGFAAMKAAAGIAPYELSNQRIKPLWSNLIVWSERYALGHGEASDPEWVEVKRLLVTEYLRQTVYSHLRCLASATKRELPF